MFMSESDREISKVGGSGGGDADADADDDEDGDREGGGGSGVHGSRGRDDDKNKQRGSGDHGYGCGSGTASFRKAKQVVLFPFTKAKKHFHPTRRTNRRLPSSSAAATAANSICSGKRVGPASANKYCRFCFTQPHTLESPVESCTSDPNDPNFTLDMLKTLIENSDFYSKECNPFLDFDDLSSYNSTG